LTGPEPGGARPRLDWRPLLVLNAVNGLRAWAHMAVVAYMAFYLQGRGWPDVYVGVAVSLHVLAGALGGMAGGAVSDRVGRRAVYTVSLVLAAALTIGIHLTSGAPMWVCLALAGAAAQATFPVAVVLAQELMPTRAGLASGMTMGLAFGLGGLGLPLSGYMGDRFGLGAVFYTSALLLLVAAVLSRRLGESRSRPAERTAAV
jgi:FSR family fosmidomycin resistance protein-like MFS transporter